MGILRLSPDRLVAYDSDGETEVRPASVWDLLPYLFHPVEVDPAFTLGDLFRLVDCEDSGLLAAILAEDIEPLLEEARTGARLDPDGSLEFVQVCNRHDEGRLHRDFEGWGAWDEPYEEAWTEQPSTPHEGGIAVELAPVTELLDLPLRYNPELVFRGPEYEVVYRTEIDITFIEFVKAVFFELTFLGSSHERDAARADLQELTEQPRARHSSPPEACRRSSVWLAMAPKSPSRSSTAVPSRSATAAIKQSTSERGVRPGARRARWSAAAARSPKGHSPADGRSGGAVVCTMV